jgi:sodium/proline symporter
MAISTLKEVRQARRIGIGWMILSLLGATATALVGIAYFQQNPNVELGDPEGVFIVLGQIFFHPLIAGFMLAAVLAAIMSTISSQLIVTSSALIEDLYKIAFKKASTDKQYVTLGRLAVLFIALIAGFLAWERNDTILDLVAYAWAGFGAAFGPIILLSLFWRKLTTWGALAGMVVGAATVIIWDSLDWEFAVNLYEIVPGFLLCLIAAVVVSLATFKPNTQIEEEFSETERLIREKPAKL